MDYRLYCIDGAGRINLADWITADSDEDAVEKARQMHPDASRCEVWHGPRMVAKFSPDGHFEWASSSKLD